MAGATFSRIKTWVAEILTYSDLNAEFDNILTNLTPSGIDDESANAAAMQTNTDPYPAASPSLATSLQGEIHRLRYVIKQITGQSQWYVDPVITLPAAAGTAYQWLQMNSGASALEFANSPATVLTAQGDIMTASAANTLARLAKGAANDHLVMEDHELMTLDVAPATTWAAGDTITGVSSTKTCLVVEKLTDLTYVVKRRSGAFTLNEVLTNGTYTADQGAANPTFAARSTKVEYAVPYKIGTFNRLMDADSGDVVTTGIGFKPKILLFIGADAAGDFQFSVGFSDATSHYCVAWTHGVVSYTFTPLATACIWLSETTDKKQTAVVKTMDADGFTLTWTKGNSPTASTANIFYIALR